MDQRRPIVVNSLLCFIHNYRRSILTNELQQIVYNYFSKSVLSVARATLIELLSRSNLTSNNCNNIVSGGTTSAATGPRAYIKADGNCNSMIDNNHTMAISSTSTTNAANISVNTIFTNNANNDSNNNNTNSTNTNSSVSSPRSSNDIIDLYDHFVINGQSSVVFAAADLSELPLILITDENDTASEVLREIRQLKLLFQNTFNDKIDESIERPILNGLHPEVGATRYVKLSSPQPSHFAKPITAVITTSSCEMFPSSYTCSQSNSPTVSAKIANSSCTRKRDVGTRLDAMVKKLTESKQKEKESMEAINTQLWPAAQMFNTVTYFNMIKSMQSMGAAAAAAAVAQSSVFQSTPTVLQADTLSSGAELLEDDCKNGDLTMDREKLLVEDSPSPSESVTNNEMMFTCSDLTKADKPYTCMHANCYKRFANKFLLKKHQFIHTGLRPHRCPFCGKRFNRKDNLLRHKKTHLANALADGNEINSEQFLLQLNATERPVLQLNTELKHEVDA